MSELPSAIPEKQNMKLTSINDLTRVESYSEGMPVRTSYFHITKDDRVFFGKAIGKTSEQLTLDNIDRLKQIPDEHIFPIVPAEVQLIAPQEISTPTFIKRSGLHSYEEPEEDSHLPYAYNAHDDLLNEAIVMEKISKGSHQNIVRFYGSRVHRGRITGLVLEKHEQTLKQCFESDPSAFACLDRDNIVSGLQSAVAFLHDLKLAHNDISPSNIMLDKHNQPVLIDFGSCGTWGQRLQTGGTAGFADEEFFISQKRNDEFSLERIKKWMKEKQGEAKQTALGDMQNR